MKEKDFQKRVEAYIKNDQRAQDRYGVTRTQQIVFGDGTHIPIVGKIALYLLRYSKARIVESLIDAPEKKEKKRRTKKK